MENYFTFCFQGGWENDETVEEAAVREAIEEAGVRGELMVRMQFAIVIQDYSSFPFRSFIHSLDVLFPPIECLHPACGEASR